MVTVRKANKVIRVIENELDKYLTKGYTIVAEPAKPQAPTVEVKPEPKAHQFAKVYRTPVVEKVAEEQPKTSRKRKR